MECRSVTARTISLGETGQQVAGVRHAGEGERQAPKVLADRGVRGFDRRGKHSQGWGLHWLIEPLLYNAQAS